VLDALASCGREVRIYGAGDRGREGSLWFRPIDEQTFVDDLATGDALVTTAGNQLVGEALHLGKPVLALPEEGNQEQYINAHFLRAGGGGDWMELADMSPARLDAFLARLDGFPGHVDRHRLDGTPAAVQAIEDQLACRSAARATRPVPCLGLAGGLAS
jgi:predicted glycosyltransferase